MTREDNPLNLSTVFWYNYDAYQKKKYRFYDNFGGTNSGKTYNLLKLLLIIGLKEGLSGIDDGGNVTTVVGCDLPNLKVGAIRQLNEIRGENDFWRSVIVEENKSNNTFTLMGGHKIEFKSYKDEQDARSGKRTRLFANEANGIPYAIFEQLMARTSDAIFIDYNPSKRFWADDHIKDRDDCISIKTTYKDNPFCPQTIKNFIEERATQPKYENWYRVYGLGEQGKLEETIYTDWQVADTWEPRGNMIAGADFGFYSPTAFIQIWVDEVTVWAKEILYKTGTMPYEMCDLLEARGFDKSIPIYCDPAQSERLNALRDRGYIAIEAVKDVISGIEHCQRYDIMVEPQSANLINELEKYRRERDKYGEITDRPVKKDDHLLDAMRYALFSSTRTDRYSTKYSMIM